ncbi:unnamed protein product, partial [Rotaria sp. Silwood1]
LLQKLPEQEIPKLIWACCLRRYGESIQPCEIGKCGLPKELEDTVQMNNDDYINMCRLASVLVAMKRNLMLVAFDRYEHVLNNR